MENGAAQMPDTWLLGSHLVACLVQQALSCMPIPALQSSLVSCT